MYLIHSKSINAIRIFWRWLIVSVRDRPGNKWPPNLSGYNSVLIVYEKCPSGVSWSSVLHHLHSQTEADGIIISLNTADPSGRWGEGKGLSCACFQCLCLEVTHFCLYLPGKVSHVAKPTLSSTEHTADDVSTPAGLRVGTTVQSITTAEDAGVQSIPSSHLPRGAWAASGSKVSSTAGLGGLLEFTCTLKHLTGAPEAYGSTVRLASVNLDLSKIFSSAEKWLFALHSWRASGAEHPLLGPLRPGFQTWCLHFTAVWLLPQ